MSPDRLGCIRYFGIETKSTSRQQAVRKFSFLPDFLPPGIAVVLLEMRQIAGPALTDERHGNISLNNEQHLFTWVGMCKNVRKKLWKALEEGVNCAFCYVETSGTME